MTARLTPGHTMGCTTWTTKVKEDGRELDVLFIGSTTIPGHKLVGNVNYPGIAEDYARSFALLKTLPCDVFLAAHGQFYNMLEKAKLAEQGKTPNPFIDPEGYRRYLDASEKSFRKLLASQSAAP